MKKVIFIIPIMFLLFMPAAFALDIDVNNYYYAHSNQVGTKLLGDKFGSTTLFADGTSGGNNGKFVSLRFQYMGLGSEKLYVKYPDGTKQFVTDTIMVLDQRTKSIQIIIEKTTNKETFAKVTAVIVDDDDSPDLIYYSFTGNTPSIYGSLGDGTTNPNPVDPPDPDPTDPPDNPSGIDAQWNPGTRRITWTKYPTGTYEIVITQPSGTKVRLPPNTKVLGINPGVNGKFTVDAVDMSGNVLATKVLNITGNDVVDPVDPVDPDPLDPDPVDPVDPNPLDPDPVCSLACQVIIDTLDCPEFDEYLGSWADMIKSTYPPPPDWNYVASVMRDTIVPAMGQEIVNRSPEIARIIADEFSSREKAVQPPQPVNYYTPPSLLPKIQDIPQAIPFDLGDQSRAFEPDYTDSKPFLIPDPAAVILSDTDNGYTYPTDTDDRSPDYTAVTKIDPDKGYKGKPSADTSSPTYKVTNPIVNDPGPEYYYINGGMTQIPIYKRKDTTVTSPDYTTTGTNTVTPDYKNP